MSHTLDLPAATQANIRAARTLHGVPPQQRMVPWRNMRHLLSTHAKASPDKDWLIAYDADGARSVHSYAAFNGWVHQLAGVLHDELGVRPGDRVATLAFNHPTTVALYFGCWVLGAAIVPLNTAEDDARLAFILRNSEAVALLAHTDHAARAQHLLHGPTEDGLGAPNIEALVTFGGAATPGLPHLDALWPTKPNTFIGVAEDAPDAPTLDSEALLVYTSGTTGAPKGVVLAQDNLLTDAHGIASWQGITGNQRLMNVLPIHHVNGIVVTLVVPLLVGGSVVLNRAFSASTFWRRIAQERVHVVSVVPTLLQFALEHAARQQAAGGSLWGDDVYAADVRHLRHIICGAGTLSVALARDFEARFGVRVLHGYGLSETTCYSCYLPIDLDWPTHQHWLTAHGYPSIGCPIVVNEMAIFSADGSGRRLGPGERGEICIRGHNVMRGYFKRPDANAEAFAFGWFRTGDEGFYREDARGRPFFFITGRIKELINRGGVKFSPFDIEEVLLEVPGVRVGLAVAFPNTYYGEEVGAYVVLAEGAVPDAARILAHCRARMTFEKAPKVVVFGDEVPVTSTGKYQRLKLRDLFAAYEGVQFRPGG